MSTAKRLVGQTALYGLSSIVGRALNYLLVPVHTAVLAPAAFGVMSELYAYVAFFNVLAVYGLETSLFRFANRPGADREHAYRTALTMVVGSSILLTIVLALLAPSLATWLGYEDQTQYLIWLAVIIGIDAVASLAFARLRLEGKAARFATIRIINIAVNVVLNLFFLYFCPKVLQENWLSAFRPLVEMVYDPNLGVGYVFLANLIANLLFLPLLWPQLRAVGLRLDWEMGKSMIKYGYPLMLMGLAGMVNEVLNRPLLKLLLPENFYPNTTPQEALGIFSANAKLAIFMSLVIQAFRYAAEPFFFSRAQEKNSPQVFAMVMRWFVISCALILLVITVNLDVLQTIFLRQEKYREGLLVVPILLLANLFLGVYYNLSVWFKLTDRTYFGTWISAGGAVLTVALNVLLIPVMGYVGCALVALACYSSMAVVCYAYGQRYFPVPYPIKAMSGYVLLALVLSVSAFWRPVEHEWLNIGYHVLLTAVFVGVVAFFEAPALRARRLA